MTSEEILRRVAEQSTIFCWTKEVTDDKGIVVVKSTKITQKMIADAINDVLGERKA